MDILINNGVNINKSLSILGSISLFNENIDTFIKESEIKIKGIIKYKELKDMDNYYLLIKSLENDSNNLGFELLETLLKNHEVAAKNNDYDYIFNNFQYLINEYNRIMTICKKYRKVDSKGKILVVDDSSIIRNFVKKIFKDEYEVLTAKDGNEAIEIVKEDKIDAILLDLNMPECNGFEVLEYFKTNNLFKKIPVSLLTGDDTKDSINKAFEYPIIDMVSKPFNESDVKSIVEKMLSVHNLD